MTDWFILQPFVHTKQDELSTHPKTALFGNAFHGPLKTHCIRCVLKFIRTSVEGKPFTMLFPISPFSIFFLVDSARKIPSLTQSFSNCFCCWTFQFWQIYSLFHQGSFIEAPVVLVTSEHLKTGQDYDAALIWTEDVTRSSFQVCLRELQNFDGKHEDISVVCVRSKTRGIFIALKLKERTGESFLSLRVVAKQDSLSLWATSTHRYKSPASRPANRRSTQLYGNTSDAMRNDPKDWSKRLKRSQFPGYE